MEDTQEEEEGTIMEGVEGTGVTHQEEDIATTDAAVDTAIQMSAIGAAHTLRRLQMRSLRTM